MIGVYILISDIFDDRLVATVTVGLILAHGATLPGVIPFQPDLGGNSLISNYLIPSHIANALILISLVYAVRQKYRHSFSVLGVATLFHVVNGFWIAVTVGLCAVVVETGSEFQNENFRLGMKNIPWSGGIIYSAISSFVILPLLATNLSAESEFEVAYIIAWVRHPHHYILSTWSVPSIATTVAFIITGFLIIYYFRDIIFNSNDKRAFACTYVVSITSIMFVGGYVLTEVVPIGAIIKLQPFHIDDFLYVILYAGIAKVAVVALHRVANQTTINYNTLSIGIVLISVIIATVTWTIPLIMMQMGSSMFVENHYQGIGGDQSISEIYIQTPQHAEDIKEAYVWIETESPLDATFLAPPDSQGFRLSTSRARVVDFKSFPFPGDAPVEWKSRMDDVCNADIRKLSNQDLYITEACSDGYKDLTEEQINHLSEKYEANWILTKNESYDLHHAYSAGEYHIYRIESSEN